MAPRTLSFATALTPDPPLQQTARYNFDAQDRQSIDNQIRATQTFLSADVINGKSGTYVTFVGDDGAVGDIVCSAGGLGGKPTVRLATAETLALSGVMFGILVESCVEGNKAHVIHSGIVGPEITGLAAGDEGWVRVSANRCEKVSVLLDEDICVGWVDPGGFLRIGAQPIASVTGAAPTAAKYLIAAATVPGELTQAVAAQALSSTFLFASASVAPLQLRRTSGTTDADVDVGYLEALSSSTTAAGFGPALRLYAKRGSGGAETTGTISIVWTNVSGGSEATKAVIKTRSAGGAPATAMEVSETAVKITALAGSGKRAVTVESDGSLGSDTGSGLDSATHVLEDATTALNANGVPTRQMSSALTFGRVGAAGSSSGPLVFRRLITGGTAGTAGTAVEIPFEMPDSTPTQRQVGRIRYEWTDPTALDPHASIIFSNLGTYGEHDWLTIASDGAMRWHGGAYAHNGYRPVFDADGNIGASVITFSEVKAALGVANSSISVNSQKITGVTAGANPGEAVEYSQLGTAVTGTTNKIAKFTAAHVVGDSTITDDGTTATFAGNVSVTGTTTIPGAGSSSERVGASTTAAGANSTAFGNGAKADSSGAVALGQGVQITGSATDTVCIGRGITTTSAQGITIGANASNHSQAVAVGVSASAGSSGVAIGYGSGASASQSVSIGRNASGGGTNNIAIGYNSSATGSGGATESIALGAAATTGYTNCIAIGGGASCTAANQALIGGANCSITSVYIGKGVTHATPAAVTVQPTGGSTNGVTGAAITIAGGKGGAAADAGGAVNIQTAAASTGTTLETRMSFAASGARTDSFPSSALHRSEHGTTGTNYVDDTGFATGTLAQSATTTIYTVAVADNTFVKVIVHGALFDTGTPSRSQQFARYGAIQRIGGTVTLTGSGGDVHTKIENGVWGSPVTIDFADSGNNLLVRVTTPALDIKVVVERIEIFVASTTA